MAALCVTQEVLQLSGVVHCVALCTETHGEDTSPDTSHTSSVETSDTSSVEAQDVLSVEPQEDLQLEGVAHSMAYCKETRDVLLCDCYSGTIEQYSHSSSSGLSRQPQKVWNLHEMHSISCPTSVHIASKMGNIFIGCDLNEGIYVLDRTSLQLVKKFAQNMNRDFDYMVVDETEALQRCTVFASSRNNDTLTIFDYSSGSVIEVLPVPVPGNIVLKDNKLYLISRIACILVIDKHLLEVQKIFALGEWSLVGGLCLDERGYICVTARKDSNHRILYSFDDGFNEVTRVQLAEIEKDDRVLDMVAADKDFIMLTQEPDWEFTMKRIRMKF